MQAATGGDNGLGAETRGAGLIGASQQGLNQLYLLKVGGGVFELVISVAPCHQYVGVVVFGGDIDGGVVADQLVAGFDAQGALVKGD